MKLIKNTKKAQGFTLIEILVVIGIIAILAAIVIIAINPARQFAQARNSQRTSNVNAILNAVGQRMADNKGIFDGTYTVPGDAVTFTCSAIPVATTTITSTDHGSATVGDLGCLAPTYIGAIPTDPQSSASGYTVRRDSVTSRVTIDAPGAELGQTISVTR